MLAARVKFFARYVSVNEAVTVLSAFPRANEARRADRARAPRVRVKAHLKRCASQTEGYSNTIKTAPLLTEDGYHIEVLLVVAGRLCTSPCVSALQARMDALAKIDREETRSEALRRSDVSRHTADAAENGLRERRANLLSMMLDQLCVSDAGALDRHLQVVASISAFGGSGHPSTCADENAGEDAPRRRSRRKRDRKPRRAARA